MPLNADIQQKNQVSYRIHQEKTSGFAVSKEVKLIIVGNVGSGKTTSINAVSEVPMISSEVKATERDAMHRKESTTVGIEYGVLQM